MTQPKRLSMKETIALQRLLLVHALITLAASVVLIVAPAVIPETINISIASNQYLLCYFLGAAEVSIAFLSFFARRIADKKALRVIAATFIVFHLMTAVLETIALIHGISLRIIFNIFLRIVISLLFWYYGIYRVKNN